MKHPMKCNEATKKTCLLHAALNQANEKLWERFVSLINVFVDPLLFLNNKDLEPEVLSAWGMECTCPPTKSVVLHLYEVRFSEDFISVLELLFLTDSK